MDLRSLSYFIAVFEHKSISAAAKACYISQPSISAAIQSLEQELDVSLFMRHARGVQATAGGDKLYPMAKQLLGQAQAIENSFHEQPDAQPFSLGLVEALGATRMTQLLKRFSDSVAGLQLTLVEPDENCDARIISDNMLQNNERFVPMWTDEFCLAIPLDHPLTLNDSITLEQLDGIDFIYRSPSLVTRTLMDAITPMGIKMHICARIRTIEYAIGLVSAGVGCALIPRDMSFNQPENIQLKSIADVKLQRVVGLAYPESQHENPLIQALTAVCR